MPTRETTPEQQEDAKRLKVIYQQWVKDSPAGKPKRTQDDVAEALGKGQSTVAQTLNGRLALTVERAIRLANLFGCKVADFSPDLARSIGELPASPPSPASSGDKATPSKIGQAVMSIGRAVSGLAVARRKMIANAAAEIIEKAGENCEDTAEALDDLGAGAQVVGISRQAPASTATVTDADWRGLREQTMRLIGRTRDHAKREEAIKLLRRLDEAIRESSVTENQSETRHGNNSPAKPSR